MLNPADDRSDFGGVTQDGAVSEENASVAKIDHLKIRVYLYKFSPEMIFARGKPQAQINTIKSAAIQGMMTYSRSLQSEFIAIKRVLEDLLQDANFIANTTIPASKRAKISEALSVLVSKASRPHEGYVVVQDVKKNPAVLKAEATDNAIINAEDITDLSKINSEELPYQGGGFPATANPDLLSVGPGLVEPGGSNFLPAGTETLLRATQRLLTQMNPIGISTLNWSSDRRRVQGILEFLSRAINYVDKEIAENIQNDSKVRAQVTQLNQVTKQYKVNRFIYDLSPEDLSRYDISQFVAGYTTSQLLGDISSAGTINAHVDLYNHIVPLKHLSEKPDAPESVRRPMFFPNSSGDYVGYTGGSRNTSNVDIPSVDPVTGELVSSISASTLVTRIAMAQTLEDNGGDSKSDEFSADVSRIELAMRLRGIYDTRKKDALLDFFRTGNPSPYLLNILNKQSTPVTTSSGRPVGIETAPGSSGNVTFSNSLGDVAAQLAQLKSITDPSVDGILLSDLVQKYDFLTIYIYKQPISPDVVEDVLLRVDPYFFDKESLFMYTPAKYLTDSITDTRNFSVYTPEFNGFVDMIAMGETAGAPNTLGLELTGSMGLLGRTRRIYNSTIFQGSVFDAAEIMDSRALTLYKNIFTDKNPLQILTILLDSTYLLRTAVPKNPNKVKVSSEREKEITQELDAKLGGTFAGEVVRDGALKSALEKELAKLQSAVTNGSDFFRQDVNGAKVVTSFFDILSLRSFNQFGEKEGGIYKGPKHLFNIPSFLYANVMRTRRFNVKIPTESQVAAMVFGENPSEVLNPYDPATPILTLPKESDGSGGSVLEINPKLDVKGSDKSFDAYFTFLSDSLGQWVPDLKTGFDIMNDVLSVCYLELFETPGGRFIYRTPQYNNNNPVYKNQLQDNRIRKQLDESELLINVDGSASVKEKDWEADNESNMITSDDIEVVSSSYSQKAQNLVSKQGMGYGADLIGQPIEQLEYFYTNGKMVSQYGLMMSRTTINPNVRFIPKDKLAKKGFTDIEAYMEGVFHYCRFFLEYANMRNFFGTVTAVGSPKIAVGRTYYDIPNQKFGYISDVNKTLDVGGRYLMTFTVVAVRDAVYGEIVGEAGEDTARPTFRRLPLMEDYIPKFKKGQAPVASRMSTQKSREKLLVETIPIPSRVLSSYPGSPLQPALRSPF